MKKFVFSIVAFASISISAMASDEVVPPDFKTADMELFKCSGWYTVKDRSGNLIDGGIYSSDETGMDCLNGFSAFINKLIKAYPDASVYGEQ